MVNVHVELVTLHHGLQLVLSKTIRSGDTTILFSVVVSRTTVDLR